MITGFNTDVKYEGQVYHVQTEDRGRENPVLESLVYIGGTIIAKKTTPYSEQLNQGADETAIAVLLKKQHQVIIAAIRAGRVEDLKRLSTKASGSQSVPGVYPQIQVPKKGKTTGSLGRKAPNNPDVNETGGTAQPPGENVSRKKSGALKRESGILSNSENASRPLRSGVLNPLKSASPVNPVRKGKTGALNLDAVISDYLKKTTEQEKLDIKVLSPNVFTAGSSINLRVQITHNEKPDYEAVVTIKIIGTAFRPQVFIGRAAADGIATFSLNLPAFSAGTAAIVIEAQSAQRRGELKSLIRRAS